MDLIDEFLNTRYQAVLDSTDWTGIRARSPIQTTAAYESAADSATFTVGSTAVTGSGTSWTGAITGRRIFRPGDTAVYVATQVSGTSLTLDRPYEGLSSEPAGTVHSGCPYVLMQSVYSLPADCKAVEHVLDAISGFPLVAFDPSRLDAAVGSRTLVGDPQAWAEIEDSAEPTNGVTVHQVELFPAPRSARGYQVEYIRNANRFNGNNLGQSPLPFVSDAVLLNGVRADLCLWQGKLPASQAYQAKYDDELARLLRVEHGQRRQITTLQLAPRFTRHRQTRVLRGYNNRGWGPGAGGPY